MKTVVIWLLTMNLLLLGGCSVMTPTIEKAAAPDQPFKELLAHPDRHLGQTVILGGYVLEVRNQPEHTRMIVIQAPLGLGREPNAKDLSQGRIMLFSKGFLDPEVYAKGRKITFGGRVTGGSLTETHPEPYPYIILEASEIYLWPKQTTPIYRPFWDDPWWGPYPWYGYYPRFWYYH